jgi:hypothetical protein
VSHLLTILKLFNVINALEEKTKQQGELMHNLRGNGILKEATIDQTISMLGNSS